MGRQNERGGMGKAKHRGAAVDPLPASHDPDLAQYRDACPPGSERAPHAPQPPQPQPQPAAAAGGGPAAVPALLGGGGRRNKIHPHNWGYTTYLDRVFGLSCFSELVRLQIFPDAKDISESYGALAAATRHGHLAPLGTRKAERADGVLCLAVGDGATPRTACLAAFLTQVRPTPPRALTLTRICSPLCPVTNCKTRQWRAISIDPALRPAWVGLEPGGVRRLRGYRGTFEEWCAEKGPGGLGAAAAGGDYAELVLLCVHAHNQFVGGAAVDVVRGRLGNPPTTLVSLPCCHQFNPQKEIGRPPEVALEDLAIFSACRGQPTTHPRASLAPSPHLCTRCEDGASGVVTRCCACPSQLSTCGGGRLGRRSRRWPSSAGSHRSSRRSRQSGPEHTRLAITPAPTASAPRSGLPTCPS